MKFLKVIIALAVLLGLQNSFVFGAEAAEGFERLTAAKDAAITVLNEYINMPSSERTPQNIMKAERALQIMNVYNERVAGPLTQNEQQLISRVQGVLPIDKGRLTGTRAGFVRRMPTRTAERAISVSRPTRTIARPTVTRTARSTRTVARPMYRPGGVTGRTLTTRTPRRVITPRLGITQQAPFIVPTPTTADLQEQLTLWFGTGNLSSFFNNDGSINNNMLMQALTSIKPYIQLLGQSPDNVSKLIGHTIVNNANSGLTFEQERMLMNEIYRSLQSTIVSAGERELSTVGAGEGEFAIKIGGGQSLQQQIMLLFGTGDLSTFFKNGTVNDEMILNAWNAIKPYSFGLSSDDIFTMISRAMRNNRNSNLTFGQQAMVLAEMNKILRAGLPQETVSVGRIGISGPEIEAIPQLLPASLMEVPLEEQIPTEEFIMTPIKVKQD